MFLAILVAPSQERGDFSVHYGVHSIGWWDVSGQFKIPIFKFLSDFKNSKTKCLSGDSKQL